MYKKSTPRLTVQFINNDTEPGTLLFEVKDRSWMNVGEILTDVAISNIMTNEYKGDPPEDLMVLVVAEFELT